MICLEPTALTKNRSDLVGRHLSGYGRSNLSGLTPGQQTTVTHEKSGNANYLVFGFLQPTDNKIFEIEFASLVDLDGGVLFQPGLRWNPGDGYKVEAFYTHIDGDAWGDNPYSNMLSSLDFADELSIRLTKQF